MAEKCIFLRIKKMVTENSIIKNARTKVSFLHVLNRNKLFQLQTFDLIQDHNFHCIVFFIITTNIITSTAIINILLNHYSCLT